MQCNKDGSRRITPLYVRPFSGDIKVAENAALPGVIHSDSDHVKFGECFRLHFVIGNKLRRFSYRRNDFSNISAWRKAAIRGCRFNWDLFLRWLVGRDATTADDGLSENVWWVGGYRYSYDRDSGLATPEELAHVRLVQIVLYLYSEGVYTREYKIADEVTDFMDSNVDYDRVQHIIDHVLTKETKAERVQMRANQCIAK